ncbi:hypothetical protein M3223_19660 [Paenibacillus pasadenensis]|uniref:hypothetical protein n=1 Tax=Paenibacillus pasadenensis TaxID=217090 RepID=UPI00203AEAC4|nr:hypothetical protein [Paenibacillus pasadenensis]MCM3749572.1 hypothetical protein [Paenibacillus pasadenensis]
MITALIIGCEIAFWALVVAGLSFRYILRMPRTGAALLIATPIVDLILLAAVLVDLQQGGTAGLTHSLGAIYIGVSIAWGHSFIAWADVRFRHRFAAGPAPVKPAKYGRKHAARERRGWLSHLLAFAIGAGILYGMILYIGDVKRTEAFMGTIRIWSLVLAIDFVISFSYTFWPRQEKGSVKEV